MTSMLARVAVSSQKVADRMLALTWAIGIMTAIILVLAAIAAWPVIREWLPSSRPPVESAASPSPSATASPNPSAAP